MHKLPKLLFALVAVLFFSTSSMAQDKLPVAEHFPGGQDSLVNFIEKTVVYPPMAKRNRVHGTCIVAFTLLEDGTVSDAKVVKNIGANCGQEALRVVKLLKFNAPGYSANYSLPVPFKL